MNEFDITSYFFDGIELLRMKGGIVMHSEIIQISEDEEEYVTRFLKQEYESEGVKFPGKLPPFDGEAALWGAKTVFVASQLLSLRDNSELDLPQLLPKYDGEMSVSAILSCDLCLRFLPKVIEKAEHLNTYNGIIQRLDSFLLTWSYSGIGRQPTNTSESLNYLDLLKSRDMIILLIERIIKRKALYTVHRQIREIVKPYMDNN
ncbi:MAG: hypothetical protein HWE22_00480 [Flavobacteriales bacterium]|nr:hypothetical protein [Flavobacteriales bacterium]